MKHISLASLIMAFKWRISLTSSIVIIEAILIILYPLFIGFAINDLLEKNYQGLTHLAILGVLSLIIGSVRRLYDTRIYASIYQQVTPEMVLNQHQSSQCVSTINARTSLLKEFIDFLENDLPEVITSAVAMIGILVIIATLNLMVFLACLALLALVLVVFYFSGSLNFRLNQGYNNQLEQQVHAVNSNQRPTISLHFAQLMRWKIKLSDLETGNFFIIWIGVIALFLYTPVTVISTGVLSYGLIFSILMYVLDYIQSISMTPIFIQKLIRLKEISQRISATE